MKWATKKILTNFRLEAGDIEILDLHAKAQVPPLSRTRFLRDLIRSLPKPSKPHAR